MLAIRLAEAADLPAALHLSNVAAATSAANFAVEPETLEAWEAEYRETSATHPWFVAVGAGDEFLGFARATPWKGRCAYAYAVEIAVYVAEEARRSGVGRALYEHLLDTLRRQGYRRALAGITQPNEVSVALHESFGMRRVALLERIGWKFDRWHDVGYWMLDLRADREEPGPIRTVGEVSAETEHWSDPERVEKFAARDPDVRLVELAGEFAEPAATRVLDLGCAGGRNLRFLVERGFDAHALDASLAMVERTRAAIEPLIGGAEARRRVRLGRMEELGYLGDGRLALVVALGIYQMARDEAELERALAETARVLAPGGRALVAVFSRGTRFRDRPLEPVAGTRFVHADPGGETVCLLRAGELDTLMASVGLDPVSPADTVERESDGSFRVVVNGLYRKT